MNQELLYTIVAFYSESFQSKNYQPKTKHLKKKNSGFVFVVATVFFVVGGVGLILRMNKFNPVKSRTMRMVLFLFINGLGLVIMTIGLILFSVYAIVATVNGWVALIVLQQLGCSISSYSCIFSFTRRSDKSATSVNSTKNKTNDKSFDKSFDKSGDKSGDKSLNSTN